MRLALPSVLIACITVATAAAHAEQPNVALETTVTLRERALSGNPAYDLVEQLTDQIGARVAGTPAEERAANWAIDAAARRRCFPSS